MNILMLTANDPAGMAIAFAKAVNRHSPHRCRLITTETRYNFEFEKDIHLPDLTRDGYEEIESLLEEADIFHFHILSDEGMRIGPFLVREYLHGKQVVHHHHGHPHFKENAHLYRDKYRRLGRTALVSTPDLLRLLPEATWMPNIVPIQDPLYRPAAEEGAGNGSIRVGHSPTRRDLKRTDLFESAMQRVMERHRGVRKIVISDTLHTRCLEIKRHCHMFFDQIGASFGVSSLEALSQGLPTLARLDDQNVEEILKFTGASSIPWIRVEDEWGLERAIEGLAVDRDLRLERGSASRLFMERYWHEEKLLQRLFAVYEGRG